MCPAAALALWSLGSAGAWTGRPTWRETEEARGRCRRRCWRRCWREPWDRDNCCCWSCWGECSDRCRRDWSCWGDWNCWGCEDSCNGTAGGRLDDGEGSQDHTDAIATPLPKETLTAAGWVAADGQLVEPCAPDELTAGKRGVALASLKDVEAALERPLACAPQALLGPTKLTAAAQEVAVLVTDRNGKLQTTTRFLHQLGPADAVVSYTPTAQKRELKKATASVVLTVTKRHTEGQAWEAACKAPTAAVRRWLQHRAQAELLDTRPATRTATGAADTLQVVASVTMTTLEKALKASGTNGVFSRPFYDTDLDREAFKVVPLPRELDLKMALQRAEWFGADGYGVVTTRRGFAVRVKAEAYDEALKLLRPDDWKGLSGKVWEVSGLPLWTGKAALKDFLQDWEVTPVYTFRQGLRRTWKVRALADPPETQLQHDWGLAVVRLADETRPAKKAPQRWQLPRGAPKQTVTFPKAWGPPPTGPPPAPPQPPATAPAARAPPARLAAAQRLPQDGATLVAAQAELQMAQAYMEQRRTGQAPPADTEDPHGYS